jgi:sugar phosphate isomerase/epimerase
MKRQFVGLQLYTVRDETVKDFPLTLRRVAEMGYDGVEFAGYGDIGSKEMAALLADLQLRALSTHVALTTIETDLERQLDYCLDIGCAYLVVPWVGEDRRSVEGFRQLSDVLNRAGQICRNRGVTLAYHNHDFEFVHHDDTYLLDILLENTDGALVKFELDTYWAAHAGVDPIAYMQMYRGRFPLIHLKDMTPERTFTEVGSGTLNIPAYYRAAADNGASIFLVENDKPAIPSLESARISLERLRTIVQ